MAVIWFAALMRMFARLGSKSAVAIVSGCRIRTVDAKRMVWSISADCPTRYCKEAAAHCEGSSALGAVVVIQAESKGIAQRRLNRFIGLPAKETNDGAIRCYSGVQAAWNEFCADVLTGPDDAQVAW